MKKRLLVFSVDYFPYVGGAEVMVREIVRRLPDYDCVLVTCRNDRGLPAREHGSLEIVRVGWGWRAFDKYVFPLTAFRAARRLHAENPFDGIWGIMANAAGIASLFFKIAHPDVFYVLSAQEGDSDAEYRSRTWFWKPLYRLVHAKADMVLAVSAFLEERTRRLGYAGKIRVLHNGVDGASFRPAEGTVPIFPHSVVTVSRLVAKNGVSDLMAAVSMLPAPYADTVLTVVGDGPLRSALKAEAAALGIAHRVVFAGAVPHAEVPRYLRSSAVFARPSLSEGFGNVFLEAMACGIPVIGTRTGGIPETVIHGRNGLLCEPGDKAGICGALGRMLGDPALRGACARAGLETAAAHSWDGIAREAAACFDSLV